MGNHSTSHVPQPGQYKVSQSTKGLIFTSVFIGLVSFVLGYQFDKSAHKSVVWQGYLTALFYFLSLALGGLFFVAIQYVVNAGWSVTVRRVAESMTAFLPWAVGLTAVYLIFGTHSMYEWLHKDVVAADPILQGKQAYLNEPFFIGRTVLFFAIWLVFGKLIVGNSLKQDQSGDESLTLKNVKYAVIFVLLFALSYSLFSVDFLMSLHPHWFSTIFGVYTFSGLFQSFFAFMVVMVVHLMKRGLLSGLVNDNHLHDLGKFMKAFTVFYAYIAFSQFMLIWYANLPEETVFYMHRAHGGWMAVSMSLLVFKFAVPFLLLLPRDAKRNADWLVKIAYLILFMQYVDIMWLVYPNFNHDHFAIPFAGIGIFIGFMGLFIAAVTRFLSRNNLVPVKDPRLHEALHHHV